MVSSNVVPSAGAAGLARIELDLPGGGTRENNKKIIVEDFVEAKGSRVPAPVREVKVGILLLSLCVIAVSAKRYLLYS